MADDPCKNNKGVLFISSKYLYPINILPVNLLKGWAAGQGLPWQVVKTNQEQCCLSMGKYNVRT